jgi:hypothetical protein
MNRFFSMIIAAILAAAGLTANAGQTKYATATNTAGVAFGPNQSAQQKVTAVLAKSDKTTATVKYYAKGGAGKLPIYQASTSGAFVVFCTNTANALNTNDVVQYVHNDGTILQTTVASVTPTSATLAAALTLAGTTSDLIYELTQQGEISIGTTALQIAGFKVFQVPADSPAYLVGDGNTNITLTVTIDD